jgi:membrane protein implicated in regulation of membrane protease activity
VHSQQLAAESFNFCYLFSKAGVEDMKPFTILSVAVLSFIALGHLLRMLFGWEAIINGAHIPLWASAIAFVIFSGLAYMLWRESRPNK